MIYCLSTFKKGTESYKSSDALMQWVFFVVVSLFTCLNHKQGPSFTHSSHQWRFMENTFKVFLNNQLENVSKNYEHKKREN